MLQDQLSAAMGTSGAPSTTAVVSMIFALLLVNSLCYCFLLHVIYRMFLGAMGYREKELGEVPGVVKKFLNIQSEE